MSLASRGVNRRELRRLRGEGGLIGVALPLSGARLFLRFRTRRAIASLALVVAAVLVMPGSSGAAPWWCGQ
jgi:hypothetical protein